MRHADTFLDSDFTWEKFEEAYNHELANDLGNLVQRLATLVHKNHVTIDKKPELVFSPEYTELMNKFEFSHAMDLVWGQVQELNKRIDDEEKPWVLAKNNDDKKLQKCLSNLVNDLLVANHMLQPFLPDTSKKIEKIFLADKIMPPKLPLFPKD